MAPTTPKDTDIPGGYAPTPSILSLDQQTPLNRSESPEAKVEDVSVVKTTSTQPATTTNNVSQFPSVHDMTTQERDAVVSEAAVGDARNSEVTKDTVVPIPVESGMISEKQIDSNTALSSHYSSDETPEPTPLQSQKGEVVDATAAGGDFAADEKQQQYEPLRTIPTSKSQNRPQLTKSKSRMTEEDIFKALSRRRTNTSTKSADGLSEEDDEIRRLMSRMFGQARQQHSEEEKTRHSGVVFRDLTVKGVGLGASLQPTVGDIFMNLPRLLKNLFTKGPKAAAAKPPVRELISNFDGCVKPGELLLVLGRPGAGCSTFLKAFCNQRNGFEAVEGNVTYGGTDSKRMAKDFRGEVIYNPEDDLHYATLTVKRTLRFALTTRTPGKESRLEGESRKDYINEFLRVVTKLFWIEHTLNTKVGDEFVRGVSGGERKRVSIAEAMITRASVQGWDNSSKGLDASTALEYVQSIRSLTNMAGTSCAVSLYQAGESLYELVDKVLLIDQGKCLYFGPSEDAKRYFLNLGFDCPDRWTTADFLTSVTDQHERSIRKGWEDRIPRSTDDFAAAYRNSDVYQKNLEDIRDFESQLEVQRRERLEARSEKNKQKNYTIPFHKQVIACTKRQFLVMIGDRASLVGKWGGLVFQGLIVGSLFYDMPKTTAGAFLRGGVMFFLLLFNALLALAEMTAAFQSKPILLKHKSFSFYRPAAYAIAQTVVDVPLIFIQVFIFDVIIYFMSNLARTASQFFISLLILWMVTMTTYAFFRFIAAWCSSLDIATRFTGVAIQILIVYTGYVIPPASMKPWFGWLRWINWVQYGFECLMANEFYNLEMQCVAPNLVPTGPGVTSEYQACTLAGSTPGSTVVSGANYIYTSFTYTRAHLWRNFGFMWAFFIFFLLLTMLGMELMKPNSTGGAVTMFKRGQVPKKIEEAIETGGRTGKGADEEMGKGTVPIEKQLSDAGDSSSSNDKETVKGVAKNETIFTFQNINYTIPYQKGERKLLSDVQGYVRPGKLTALMGASGAGKTTLLNTLAQRIRFGKVSGDFLVDGRPLPKSFQRATGFAEQMDIHEPTATVREALQFSALLRQPREVPIKEKYEYCETIIDLLEMRDIAGATIGKIGEGLNQEQRKRLTIGVELASKPELLLFLDEPTSGLDSGAAFNIVRFLRKLTDAGQAVLCTIHQPSAVLFEHFDELLLLKSGGRVVYHGPLGNDSQNLIGYFQENGARKCPPDANPAEYMLEVIGAGDPNYKGKDWGDVWANSPNRQSRSDEIAEMIETRQQVEQTATLKDQREYAMPLSVQTRAVVHRTFVAYWRTPNYILGKTFLHIVTGLFNCFTFYKLGYTVIDFQSRLFAVFLTLTISPPLIQQLQPVFLASRNIFESRENNAKIYSWFAWVTAAVLAEIPYSLIAGSVYFCCWWFGVIGWINLGFPSGFIFLCICLFELYYVGFGQAIAAFAPNDLLASLLVPIFFLFVVSFCGVVVPPASLPTFWRSWMYWLTPFHYLLEMMLGVIVHDQPVRCASNELARFNPPPGQTCDSYTSYYTSQMGGYVQTTANGTCELCQYSNGDQWGQQFSVYYRNDWRDFGIFCGFVVFNFAIVYVATWLRFRGKNPFKALMMKRKSK